MAAVKTSDEADGAPALLTDQVRIARSGDNKRLTLGDVVGLVGAGSGTTDFLPIWTSATALGNSPLSYVGGNLAATLANGAGANPGGEFSIAGGIGGATGDGGPIELLGGAAGATSGAGGYLDGRGGAATADGNGGYVFFRGGDAGTGTGTGGDATLAAGTGGQTAGNGGALSLTAGNAFFTDGGGGAVSIIGGLSFGGNHVGGPISLQAGDGSGTSRGGNIAIQAGSGGFGGTGDGGDINLIPGLGAGGGAAGKINAGKIHSTFVSASVLGAAIANAGSGGTNGAAVLTVVGGTLAAGGTAATFNATIAGNVLVSIDSVANPGGYSVIPSDPVALTGGSLSGATVTIAPNWTYAPAIVVGALGNSGHPVLLLDGSTSGPGNNYLTIHGADNNNILIEVGGIDIGNGITFRTQVGGSVIFQDAVSGNFATSMGANGFSVNYNVVQPISLATQGDIIIDASHDVTINADTGRVLVATGGLVLGGATGGSQGAGTVNADAYYIGGADITGLFDTAGAAAAAQAASAPAFGAAATVASGGAATLNTLGGIVTSEALVGQVAYTLTLTDNKITSGSVVLVSATNSANLPVTVNSITPSSNQVVIVVGMAALTGTVKIAFGVLN